MCCEQPISWPQFAVIMKVGPHCGMTLDEIVKSKLTEESKYGMHYWGYSGTACRPCRVLEFVNESMAIQASPPVLLLVATQSAYHSPVGKIRTFSTAEGEVSNLPPEVQLQGAEFSFVCRGLRSVQADLRLSQYLVVGGKNNGLPLHLHLRSRVNKACVRLTTADPLLDTSTCHVAYATDLIEPFVVSLNSN